MDSYTSIVLYIKIKGVYENMMETALPTCITKVIVLFDGKNLAIK